MDEILHWLADPSIFRAIFGWGSKRERALAINNMLAFAVVLYCLYDAYYMTAGLFFIYVVITLILKINMMDKALQEAAHEGKGAGKS